MTDLGGSFNCDYQVEKQIKNLIKKFGIKCCIETGTYTGNTAMWMSKLVDEVYTVEITDKWFNYSSHKFEKNKIKNINLSKNNSINFLQMQLFNIKKKYDKVLCFLDAHWEKEWPLNTEIIEIAKVYKDNVIIVIDDVMVPNRNFQYDSYKGIPCNFDFVKEALSHIGNYIYYYNNTSESYHPNLRPTCIGVGKMYIVSKNLLKKYNVKEEELFKFEKYNNYAVHIQI